MDSWKKTVPSYIRTFLDLYIGEIEKEKMSEIADICNTVISDCNFIVCFNSSRRDDKFVGDYIERDINGFTPSPYLKMLCKNFTRLYKDDMNVLSIAGFSSEQDKDAFLQRIFNFTGYFAEDWKIYKMEFLDICEQYAQYFEINDGKINIL